MIAVQNVWRTALITAAVAFAAGALGVYAGLSISGSNHGAEHSSLDAIVHRELDLSAEQNQRIEELEAAYADRKRHLEAEMRAATKDIAASIAEDKDYTDRVRAAIDRFHNAMGELQHETIMHVFKMRAVLTPAQQVDFDKIVHSELVDSTQHAEPD